MSGANIESKLVNDIVLVEDQNDISTLLNRGYGNYIEKNHLELPHHEALFLLERGDITMKSGRKAMGFKEMFEIATGLDKEAKVKYAVYKDMRMRGFMPKTGFKFGAHFRVYEKGAKVGEDHSMFLVHGVPEETSYTMPELSRMVRLAHGVHKKLILGIVDSEGDVTYYSVNREKL